MSEVVISGAGAACAVGTGCVALWDALAAGRDGLAPVRRFSVAEFKAKHAGLWPGWEGEAPRGHAALDLALVAGREAWANARLDSVSPSRVAVIVGTCFAEDLEGFSELPRNLASALGATGPAFTVSTACSSSTTALGLGRDLIERGVVDVVVAGGVDVMTRDVFAGFHAIGVMSEGKCAPFGSPPGLTLGEGAGFVVLEREVGARGRGAEVLAQVLGYGLSGDGFHETAPDPSGAGVARAVRAALADAGVPSEEIDFVSAHATGTESNDVAETLGIAAALGPDVPTSATKSFLGHAQGAAGALELIALLLCMRRGLVPASLRASPRRAGAPRAVVDSERPVALPVRRALKLSAAFGGANAALVVGSSAAADPARSAATPPRRPVFVAGVSAVGPHGFDVTGLEAALTAGAVLSGSVPSFELSRFVRSAPDRNVDPSGRYCSAAAALALADAKVVVRGAARERSGLFTASTRMPARSVYECRASIRDRGILGVAAVPFSHMVLNAPAGTAAKLLALKGPLLALSSGVSSGLFAIIRAAEHLASRRCADLLVAGGLEELPVAEDPLTDPRALLAEGGAFAALRCEGEGVAALPGWAVAAPGDVAVAAALAMEGCGDVDGVVAAMPSANVSLRGTAADPARLPLGWVDMSALAPKAGACTSAFAFVLAVDRVRRGLARRLLVVSACEALACAVVVAGGPHGQ